MHNGVDGWAQREGPVGGLVSSTSRFYQRRSAAHSGPKRAVYSTKLSCSTRVDVRAARDAGLTSWKAQMVSIWFGLAVVDAAGHDVR
jgi:hypothetical protein